MRSCCEYLAMAAGDLVVRPCCADDAAGLAEMYALDRDEIEDAEPWRAPTFFEVNGQLDRITRVWTEQRTLGFVAVQRERIVGLFVLEDVTNESATVGYYVASARRREGVATRGLLLLIRIAFCDVGIRRLVADIRPDNIGSLRVAEHNGFRYEKSVSVEGVEYDRLVLSHDHVSEHPRQ
jgi:ribosomal-protein-alanine N-acetyltransferase